MPSPTLLFILAVCLFGGAAGADGADWPRFRGPNGSGVAQNAQPPIEFGPAKTVLWKSDVPRGLSSPIVTNNRVFLTALVDNQLVTFAYDAANGRELWRQVAPAETIEKTHEFSSPAAATPCTDGKHVFVYFNSYGALAYDLAGNEVWRNPLKTLPVRYGSASSPVLVGDLLIVQRDASSADAEILALDAATGEQRWSVPRPPGGGSHSTPMVWRHDGGEDLMVLGTGRLAALNPSDGQTRWWVNGWGFVAITTPIVAGDVLLAGGGGVGDPAEPRDPLFNWPKLIAEYDANKDGRLAIDEVPQSLGLHVRKEVPKEAPGNFMSLRSIMSSFMDRDNNKIISKLEWELTIAFMTDRQNADLLVAIRPGGKDDATKTHVAWETTRALPEMPSPLVYDNRLYLIRSGGLLSVIEPATGKRIADRHRLNAGGLYVASPVGANGHIYLVNDAGSFTVLRAGDTVDVVAQNDLNETVRATPAISGDTFFVRTEKHLWAFAGK
jgi:outer membrane protein assembly factor BamB